MSSEPLHYGSKQEKRTEATPITERLASLKLKTSTRSKGVQTNTLNPAWVPFAQVLSQAKEVAWLHLGAPTQLCLAAFWDG